MGPVVPAQGLAPAPAAGEPTALDLAAALRLAGVENPTINLALERIREALAQHQSARVLLVPNLNIGGSYHDHTGPVLASSGAITNLTAQDTYLGMGAQAITAGSVVIPGLWLSASLGDAVYEPLVARENVTARRSDSAAVQNAVLGDVATAYLRLVGSEARLEVLRRVDVEGGEVVRLTTEWSKTGAGREANAKRASAFNNLIERQRRAAEEEVGVASARLSRLLNIDPGHQLRTPGASPEPFRLIPEDTDAEALIAQALQARPEIAAQSANIREAQLRARQEKVRPFLPNVAAGVSTGAFGGGSNLVTPRFSPLSGRTDFDVLAVWNIQNLGFGNRARVREANSTVAQALAEYDATKNRIRREVLDALADARAATGRLETARAAVITSTEGFQLDLQRIRAGGVGRNAPKPIELLDSFREIVDARQALVAAITEFDVAQFRLYVAVGGNPVTGPDVSSAVPATVTDVPIRPAPGAPQPVPIMPTPVPPGKP
jgi:outer membrane protein TolC